MDEEVKDAAPIVDVVIGNEEVARLIAAVMAANALTVAAYFGGRKIAQEIHIRREVRKMKKATEKV